MRMVAVTMTPRINPCASAAMTSGSVALDWRAIMMLPLPTNTSAQTPMNSAMKCRTASLMSELRERVGRAAKLGRTSPRRHPPRRAGRLVVAPHHERGVDPPEPERVAHHAVEVRMASHRRHVVQVARGVGRSQIHGWRDPPMPKRHRADGGLDGARGAKRVPVVALRAGHG